MRTHKESLKMIKVRRIEGEKEAAMACMESELRLGLALRARAEGIRTIQIPRMNG